MQIKTLVFFNSSSPEMRFFQPDTIVGPSTAILQMIRHWDIYYAQPRLMHNRCLCRSSSNCLPASAKVIKGYLSMLSTKVSVAACKATCRACSQAYSSSLVSRASGKAFGLSNSYSVTGQHIMPLDAFHVHEQDIWHTLLRQCRYRTEV